MELFRKEPSLSSSFSTSFQTLNPPLSYALKPQTLQLLTKRRKPSWRFLITNTGKKKNNNNNEEELSSLKEMQKESKSRLSHILRTEAAIRGVERKAGLSQSKRLWPKAVLEALTLSIEKCQWESALKIFGLLRIQHWYVPKSDTYVKLLMMLAKCKQILPASSLYQTMLSEGLKPTVDVYTSLMSVYGLTGHLPEAFRVLDEMKCVSDCKPDAYAYTLLINCCTKFRQFNMIEELLKEMTYLGMTCSVVTYNTIIDGYGKAGMFQQMERVLSDMLERGTCLPDVYTMNSFIWAYGNKGQIEKMETWYQEFQVMGIDPDMTTFNTLIKCYGKWSLYDKMGLVLDYMKKRFYSPTVLTFNILIESFGRVGDIERMDYFFDVMKKQGVKPNCITYTSLINAYSKVGLLQKFATILRQINNSDVALDTKFFNCIISAYGRAGQLTMMENMFEMMKERKCTPDHITYASMIQAYNDKGMFDASEDLETVIEAQKHLPLRKVVN